MNHFEQRRHDDRRADERAMAWGVALLFMVVAAAWVVALVI